ncbi:TetR family transcriptional regulator [Vallitalea pronyensis]|uniref:TetR family transcriptional regulator n=1 Tax=Vallitalea pronyensis TaxID=1348613 RepID=A0A8J8MPR4_9FIRM|nr:TetR/AcrR family transcriptional regulator [Vallitalea pronyensis]QUI25354.1 TetR family transcriptional regulator [Vallitalea pronyensis]
MRFERARTNEQRQERKKEILKACATLYDESGIDGVHFKAVSEITSFVRSTIYTYYKTKEEILLDLLLEDIKTWSSDVHFIIETHDVLSKEHYCHELTNTFVNNTRMLQLMSILYSILEKNCSLEKLTAFKSELTGLMRPLITSIDKYFPDSDDDSKRTFFYTLYCFVSGLYPTTNITQKQKEAIKNSGIDFHPVDFGTMCYKGLYALASEL